MPARTRPLSPHLQIYRWQIGNSLSILHRLTGIALSLGLLALSYWLIALAGGEQTYRTAARIFSGPIGLIVLIGWTFAFLYPFAERRAAPGLGSGQGIRAARAASERLVGGDRRGGVDAVHLAVVVALSTRMSLRSPLGRVLGTGSAKDGTGQWWAERVSAVALIPLDAVVLLLVAGLADAQLRRGATRGWRCR